MQKLNQQEIRKLARKIIAERPGGIRASALVKEISSRSSETPVNTIWGSTYNLQTLFPDEIAKPSRGLYQRVATATEPEATSSPPSASEKDFYEPFAHWLKDDLDEVTVAVAFGGATFKTKWGTPDVVGVYRPTASDLVRFSPEVVAVEIKVDPQQPVVAFGQAIAYRLFATKSYVVMPRTISEADLSRLEALAMLFGLGLVVFDPVVEEPDFAIRVRAQRFVPDMFYVNEFADRLREFDRDTFEKLFG